MAVFDVPRALGDGKDFARVTIRRGVEPLRENQLLKV